jgi:hypothetical protein
MLNELDSCGAETKHALALRDKRILSLLVAYVDVEGFTFQKELQIAVVLQGWMRRGLVQHAFQGLPSRLDEIGVEAPYSLLLWRGRNYDARIVAVKLVVQPQKVAEAAGDCEFRIPISLGRRLDSSLAPGGPSNEEHYLCIDLVLGMGTRQVANFVRIANGDVEEGLGRLDNANAWLCWSRRRIAGRGFDGRRHSGFGGRDVVVVVTAVVIQADIAHQGLERSARRGWRPLRVLLGEGGDDGFRQRRWNVAP